jgi:hypothetical protein
MSEIEPVSSHFLVYVDEAGNAKIDVRFDGETVWLTQEQIVSLFESSKANISEHIKNVLTEGELSAEATVRDFRTVRQEGSRQVSRNITHYNLDMIISVGYRVKSRTATRFRIWATAHLRELIVKGFVLDDERLANPDLPFDYFDELLERIQRITDVYATSLDYDGSRDCTQPSRRHQGEHGPDLVAGSPAAQYRRRYRQELLPRRGIVRAKQPSRAIPGLCRRPIPPPRPHADGRLDHQTGRFPRAQRP